MQNRNRYFFLILLMLLTSCSPKINFKKLSKQIEEKNNIEYPVQGSSRPYSICNIAIRKDFLEDILRRVKIKDSTNIIFIEHHDYKTIYYALKAEENVYYYERKDFLECKGGKELFFPQKYDHGFERVVRHILLDLGKDLSYDKVLEASEKHRVSDGGFVYLTVFDVNDSKIVISKTLNFNEYYNIKYDEW